MRASLTGQGTKCYVLSTMYTVIASPRQEPDGLLAEAGGGSGSCIQSKDPGGAQYVRFGKVELPRRVHSSSKALVFSRILTRRLVTRKSQSLAEAPYHVQRSPTQSGINLFDLSRLLQPLWSSCICLINASFLRRPHNRNNPQTRPLECMLPRAQVLATIVPRSLAQPAHSYPLLCARTIFVSLSGP